MFEATEIQYMSKSKGRKIDTFGLEPDHEKYCGGTIYCDHGSQLLHAEHQTSLGASDTARSTKIFERMVLSHGELFKDIMVTMAYLLLNSFKLISNHSIRL